jgi:isoleucyl-tRNA synthetase
MLSPLDEDGVVLPGFGAFSGRRASELATTVPEALRERGLFYKLESVNHRYPHCWRCQTPLVYRLVDEWFLRMGPLYDKPRAELTPAELAASLRYQVMDLVDQVRWKPAFGRERELDWLRNMGDWMLSKKRYWGLALPFYECAACGTLTVVGGRDELKELALSGWEQFEGHSPHRPWVDAVKVACSGCGQAVSRVADVGNPWLDAGVVPFSTLRARLDPEYWARWFPADLVAESFPGQFRNWFYALLVMSAVLGGRPPFRTLFGHGLVLASDGAAMHKSSGNSVEFDEAAERFGADAMRWMFAAAAPEDDLLFGEQSVAAARRQMLVLWNVYSFFVTYANLAGWTPATDLTLDPKEVRAWPATDRWVLSRTAHLAAELERLLRSYEASAAMSVLEAFLGDLSTWYLRRSRERMRPEADKAGRDRAFATLYTVLTTLTRLVAPVVPFLAETMYQNLVVGLNPAALDSVHLSTWPTGELAEFADPDLESEMALARRVVEAARTLRASCGLRVRQPLARMWLATSGAPLSQELLALVGQEVNVEAVELLAEHSELLDWRVKPLLPVLGHKLGAKMPSVMAAARTGAFELRPDGSVVLAGVTLQADEFEVQAVPKQGTAMASEDGLVVMLDTTLTVELRARGDVRDLARLVALLRKDAGVELDTTVTVGLEASDAVYACLAPYLVDLERETRSRFEFRQARADERQMPAELDCGAMRLWLVT